MTAYRVTATFLGFILAAAIVWASLTGAIVEEGVAMLALPWGLVTFIDLYVSFFFAASVILFAEPNRSIGVVLALLVFVLGGVVTAAWAVWRAPLLWLRLRGQPGVPQPNAL